MAHQITNTDRFGYVGQPAWHGLGLQIEAGLSAEEGFKQIGLGWDTELLPIFAQLTDGTKVEIKDKRAHRRCDTGDVLGVVSDDYKSISNQQLAQFADQVAGLDKAVQIETGGSLLGGRRIFCLVKLPREIEAAPGDVLKQYIAVTNGHGGWAAFACYPTSVRIVCANTLRLSENDVQKGVRFHHTGDLESKLATAKLVLGTADAEVKRFEERVQALVRTNLSKQKVVAFMHKNFETLFGKPEGDVEAYNLRRAELVKKWTEYMENERNSLAGIRGTAWSAFNAVTEWLDHDRGTAGPVSESDRRVHSNIFGESSNNKRRVLRNALALV